MSSCSPAAARCTSTTRSGRIPKLTTTFTHHEQALSMAAEAYYRLTNRLAVVNVTSGPGGTNAITGVYGAYVDSIGMLVHLGPGEDRDDGARHGPAAAPVRRSGTRYRGAGPADHQIRDDGHSTRSDDPLPSRKGAVSRHQRPARAGLARHPARRAGHEDRSRSARPASIPPSSTSRGKRPISQPRPAAILERLRAAERPVVFAGGGVRLSRRA